MNKEEEKRAIFHQIADELGIPEGTIEERRKMIHEQQKLAKEKGELKTIHDLLLKLQAKYKNFYEEPEVLSVIDLIKEYDSIKKKLEIWKSMTPERVARNIQRHEKNLQEVFNEISDIEYELRMGDRDKW